jgi:hypothetical protein
MSNEATTLGEMHADEPRTDPIPEITPDRAQELERIRNSAAVADQAVLDAGEAFRTIGQIESLDFVRHVADVAAAQAFDKIRKNKGYKNLPYTDAEGNRRYVADLEEFCQVFLGKSARRVRELTQNLHTLGSDLYESAERIGFRAKDYRALKALPPEEQEVVKQAIASESREQVLDILQDMAARHASEKAAAKKEAADLKADMEAKDKVLQAKQQRLDKAETDLAKLKSLPKNADTELRLEREAEAVKQLNGLHIETLAKFKEFLAQIEAVTETEGISAHTASYAMQVAQVLCEDIGAALAEQGVPVDFADIVQPEWLRDEAKADHEAGKVTDAFGGLH